MILSACQLLLHLEAAAHNRRTAAEPGSQNLTAALLGDIGAAHRSMGQESFSMEEVLACLRAAIERAGLTDLQVDQLLEDAESVSVQVLEARDPLMPIARGTATGPWDVSEVGPAGVSLMDLGGLRIPMPSSHDQIRMEAGGGGAPVAVTVVHGSTALQLQAFRSSASRNWGAVRGELGDSIKASGGQAQEWAGPAGVELRVDLPVAKPSGRMKVRMLGCDGPGWLLRGIISGDGAAPESQDMWAYSLFLDTVVCPTGSDGGGGVICLRSPQS